MPKQRREITVFGKNTGNKIFKLARDTLGARGPGSTSRNPSGGNETRHFVLLEDFKANGPCWAKWVSRLGTTSRGEFQLYSFGNLIDGALPGYRCQATYIDSEWSISFGGCPDQCSSSGTIINVAWPGGTVSTPYTHTVTGSNLNANSFGATGLPAGLSMANTGAVTGTPTTAGTYLVIVTATSPGTGVDTGNTCTITKAFQVTIAEA